MYALRTIFLQARTYSDEPMTSEMKWLLIIGAIALIIIIISASKKRAGAIHSNKVFTFVDFKFSTLEYYAALEKIITARQMPHVNFSRVTYALGGLGEGKGEYLRVDRIDDIFDICAAPFGTGSFVSYWYGEPKKRIKELAYQIPKVNTVMDAFDNKTRYELDTATVFRTWVKECIDEAIDEITGQKGVRKHLEIE